jgi:hypothetical protein
MILDIDRVFSAEELSQVRGGQEAGKPETGRQPVEKQQIADRQLVGAAA